MDEFQTDLFSLLRQHVASQGRIAEALETLVDSNLTKEEEGLQG